MQMKNDLGKLIINLPIYLQTQIKLHHLNDEVLEIILDLGKKPEARFSNGPEYLSQKSISRQDLNYMVRRIGRFNNENRAGIDRTLHRISCIRNRQFLITGLTCRIGRSIFGAICAIKDLLFSNHSILFLGNPGVGKTTIIREIARVLANEMEKRVVVIDTSNEIAGDSDIPHLGIGRARRMQVRQTELQHQVMIEAVENHMPHVIIIDEIGTDLEVIAAQTIAEKGVQLIGTTHGNCLENLIKNPLLANLIGGIQYVTLSDEESKRRGTQKTISERKFYPTFGIIIELNRKTLWGVHENVTSSIDLSLSNNVPLSHIRKSISNESIQVQCSRFYGRKNYGKLSHIQDYNWLMLNISFQPKSIIFLATNFLIYPYSMSHNLLKEILLKLGLKFTITSNIKQASFIVGLKKHLKRNSKLKKLAIQKKTPIYSINEISIYQLAKLFYSFKLFQL